MSSEKIRTYIKWVGNKSCMWKKILSLRPIDYESYYEPFLGSAAIFLKIFSDSSAYHKPKTNKYYLSDINIHLINCHLVIANHLKNLKRKLNYFDSRDTESFFSRQRKLISNPLTRLGYDITNAARLIYLNRRSYGGMWRLNKKGEFNVPKSPDQKKSLYSKNIDQCSKCLQKATIEYKNYEHITPKENDFIFFDPPYFPISSSSSFTMYTKGGWLKEDHEKLFSFIHELSSRKIKILMTNSDCAFVRDNFPSNIYKITKIPTIRYIDALTYQTKNGSQKKKSKRETIYDLAIKNY